MKTLSLIVATGMLAGSLAFAADQEAKENTTVDHSKNPITGTETTTKTYKNKMKGAHAESDVKVKETTKHKKDGSTSTKTEVDGDTSHESK